MTSVHWPAAPGLTRMTNTLDYSKPRPRRRRSVRKKDLVVVFLFLCAALVLWRWNDIHPYYLTTRAYLAQRAAMGYRQPDGHVAYTEEAETAKRLLAADPASYVRLWQSDVAMYDAGAWREMRYWRAPNMPGQAVRDRATVFLHARHNPNAGTRLVVVEMRPTDYADRGLRGPRAFHFGVECVTPGTINAYWQPGTGSSNELDLPAIMPDQRLTVFTGRPDPTDASRFTIDYTLDGVRHAIDGRLGDNGWIVLSARE